MACTVGIGDMAANLVDMAASYSVDMVANYSVDVVANSVDLTAHFAAGLDCMD